MPVIMTLKHKDGTLVTAQEAYDAFMTTRVLINYSGKIHLASSIEWYDNNSAQSDPTNVGYVIMYYLDPNSVAGTPFIGIGDMSLKPA